MAAVGREAGGAVLFYKQHRQLAGRPARCHRSSPEGGGFFFRRGAAEAVPDDLQQLRLPLGEPAQVALQQIPPRLDVTPSMPSLHERFERGVVDQAVRLGEARQATDGDLAVPCSGTGAPESRSPCRALRRVALGSSPVPTADGTARSSGTATADASACGTAPGRTPPPRASPAPASASAHNTAGERDRAGYNHPLSERDPNETI